MQEQGRFQKVTVMNPLGASSSSGPYVNEPPNTATQATANPQLSGDTETSLVIYRRNWLIMHLCS